MNNFWVFDSNTVLAIIGILLTAYFGIRELR